MNGIIRFKRYLIDKLRYKRTIYIVVNPIGITSGRIPLRGYAGTTGRLDEVARSFMSIINEDSLGVAYLLGPPSPHLQLVYDPEECPRSPTERSIIDEIRKRYLGKRSCIRLWKVPLEVSLTIFKKYLYFIYLLLEEGEDLDVSKLPDRAIFLLGSHIDIPVDLLDRIKGFIDLKVSIGPFSYQASQVIAYLEYAKGVC